MTSGAHKSGRRARFNLDVRVRFLDHAAMQVTMIGGGSRQWGPKLTTDLLITPSLAEVDLVLHDVDEASLPLMERYGAMLVERLGIGATVRTTTDRRAALEGADFVGVCISTGGF